ncbi:hypothetical protein AX15_007662 [Amanita polypyramis BW_CC]|nr:hypothetical protein AX15_007662 [Amanita polypyramis BW_CC]
MYPRPDSPPPRQPSPDLVPTPLSTPPRYARGRVDSPKPPLRSPSQQLTTSRSYDGFGNNKRSHKCSRSLMQSRSYDNIRLREDLPLSQTTTTSHESPKKARCITFCPSPSLQTAVPPPVPPLPAFLRMRSDDLDVEKSSELSCDGLFGLTSSSTKESTRRQCRSPPPPVKRRLVPFTRIRLFSWGDTRSRSHATTV